MNICRVNQPWEGCHLLAWCIFEVDKLWVKGKGKFTLEQATKGQRYNSSFFNLGGRWGWVVNATLRSL
jgi:hypothetical protein